MLNRHWSVRLLKQGLAALGLLLLASCIALAQDPPDGGGGDGGGDAGGGANGGGDAGGGANGGTGDGGGGDLFPAPAGVEIDPNGVLRVRQLDPQLAEVQRQAARRSASGRDASLKSPLRKVSLNRLEASLAKSLGEGQRLNQEMATLAGLTRIEYVMFYPASGDIVVAGPAEAVFLTPAGQPVGLDSGRPTIRLEDLIVALRAYPAGGPATSVISCSIDPTQEGLKRMQQFLVQAAAGYSSPNQAPIIAQGLKQSLGLQTVSLKGVPTSTRFAQVMVEADYRMKLIGIGLEQPPIRLTSWVERAAHTDGGIGQMQRWFFVPNYDAIQVSPDQHVMRLSGQGVKLVGEQERVAADGSRSAAGRRESRASRSFTEEFTRQYENLAEVSPVFADLRNLFDLSVVAAFIHKQQWYQASGWDQGLLADESRLPVEWRTSPQQVETAVNAIWVGGRLLTPLGGGIHIAPGRMIKSEQTVIDASLEQLPADQERVLNIPADRWWWD
jgi:hypothetical protein